MDESTRQFAQALTKLLREHMRSSPELCAMVASIAESILEEARRLEDSNERDAIRESPTTPQTIENTAPVPTVSRSLKIGGVTVDLDVPATGEMQTSPQSESAERLQTGPTRPKNALDEIELSLIIRRTRLKAEACSLAVQRLQVRELIEQDPVLTEREIDMVREAKAMPNCFLWPIWRWKTTLNEEVYRACGQCYEAVAEAAELCTLAIKHEDLVSVEEIKGAFTLLAEASSALRVALQKTWLTEADRDQEESHLWLRRETFDRRIYMDRYMSLSDPGSPDRAPQLIEDVRALRGLLRERVDQQRLVYSLFSTANYHAKKLTNDSVHDAHDYRKLNRTIELLREQKVRQDDHRFHRIRQLLADVEPPADIEIHPWLLTKSSGPPNPNGTEYQAEPWSARVLKARELLRGGRIVIIGGEPRPEPSERIRRAFELEEVEWVPLTEHGSSTVMDGPIFRSETKLVVVIIKLTGHLHAVMAREYAKSANKPLVMLPAGYNPEQIAEQVLQQATDKLSAV